METKTRTALPRPRNNAFAQGRPLVRPANLHLLSELPADLPTKLFAKANPVQLAAGKILFRAGAIGDGCYRVEDGLLKVTMVSGSGAERILQFLGPSAIVGELSTIDGLRRSATVAAVRDATLSWVSRAEFEAFAEEHPEVYKSLVKLLARRLRDTDAVVAASSFLSLKGRVARTVLELVDHFGQEVAPGRIVIRQKIGHNDLAAMAGIARENLTRVLNDWQRHKVLTRLSGYYCLEDKIQLEHQAKL
jgi:CRP-like cAMP-binding protein